MTNIQDYFRAILGILLLSTAGHALEVEIKENELKELRTIFANCFKETGAKPRDILKIVTDRIEETDEVTSSFFKCFTDYYGVIDEKCNFDLEVANAILYDSPKNMDADEATNTLKNCFAKRGRTDTQSCGAVYQCLIRGNVLDIPNFLITVLEPFV